MHQPYPTTALSSPRATRIAAWRMQPLLLAIVLGLAGHGALVSAPVQAQNLPLLGETVALSPAAERRLGDRIVRDLYRDPDYSDDPIVGDYLQSIWQPLLAAAKARGDISPELDAAFAWTLLLGKDRSVNAFALPGGYFGIHLGLVGVVTNRDELASVLAHELSHVSQRHIARLISRQSEQTPWLVGAMILGALAASKNPAAANAVMVGGSAAAAQTQLNFSRDMEREADRAGLHVSTAAGFAPQGFVSMFEKLQQGNRNNDAGNFPYLRSHPLTTERIADMQSRMPASAAPAPLGSVEHTMVSARARLLSNATVDGLRSWYAEADAPVLAKQAPMQQAASLYGAALAALKLREFDKAAAYASALETVLGSDAPARRLGRLLRAELAVAQGQPDAALRALGALSAPATRAELLAWIPLQVATAHADVAAEAAQLWLLDHPTDASMWQQLASARAAQGRTVASVRAEAEVNIAQLDYAAALRRLQAAQALSRTPQSADPIEASIVDVRLRQVEQWLREQATER